MGIFKNCIKKIGSKYEFIDNQELRQEMSSLVKIINQNSKLPMPILTEYNTEVIPKANKYIPNFMSNDYYYDDYTLIFSGYPTDEDSDLLTDIEIHSEDYNLLGIAMNTEVNEAIKKLVEFGFEKTTNKGTNFRNYSDNKEVVCFEKLDVKIAIKLCGESVSKILVSVVTYYLGNRLY